VILVLDFGTFGDGESHIPEDADYLIRDAGQWMQFARRRPPAWERYIDAFVSIDLFFELALPRCQGLFDHGPKLTAGLSDGRSLGCRQGSDAAHDLAQSASAARELNPDLLESSDVPGRGNQLFSMRLQYLYLIQHCLTPPRRTIGYISGNTIGSVGMIVKRGVASR
jgi:hypothetical protein